ncbi:hypothetical protein O181_055284 [Austropuccinia psidii MF-1]|uniref:Uncharacterized protein n=1 Tax=Austropuccinia psidii MF-1 TaxID=1389203 RepID=A0A9Q3E689_9BASI|nr:hypothetical protein [Austropuccinia psidii MF-1]
MIHRNTIRQFRGDLEHSVKSRTIEQSSAEDMINILEEVTTRPRIGSRRVNIKTRFNTPLKDYLDKNTKGNSNNIKYNSTYVMRKCHIFQSTTYLANTCPRKEKINEIYIEKEPDVEKDDLIEDDSDEKSSIFSEYSKDIENKNVTFDMMESHSHFPQLRNGQIDLSKIQDAQLMRTKPKRGKGNTAGNSCITELVINNKPTKLLLGREAFCSCVGKSFLKTCVPNFEDQLLPIDGIKFKSQSSPMKVLGIFESTFISPQINGNLRITVKFLDMEKFSSTHFILGNDYLIITVNKLLQVNLELERFKSEQLNEAESSIHLTDKQESELSALLYDHKEAFASDKEPLGEIIGHEVDIILNIERPYPPLLRRPAYPASPKSREAMGIYIKELLDLGVIRKVGHNEEIDITIPVIVPCHN